MLDKKHIEAYNNIKADGDLKEKILLRADENFRAKKQYDKFFFIKSTVCAAAACAIIVLGILIFKVQISKSTSPQLLYKSEVISAKSTELEDSETIAVSFGTKHINASGLPLEIKTDRETKVSVSHGTLQAFHEDTKELILVGTDFTINEDVVLFWDLSSVTHDSPCLVTECDETYSEYILEESKENGYIIRLAKRFTK